MCFSTRKLCMHASREEAKSIVNTSLIAHSKQHSVCLSVCVCAYSVRSLIAYLGNNNKVVENIHMYHRSGLQLRSDLYRVAIEFISLLLIGMKVVQPLIVWFDQSLAYYLYRQFGYDGRGLYMVERGGVSKPNFLTDSITFSNRSGLTENKKPSTNY